MKNNLETVIKQVRLEGGMNYIRSALPRKSRMAFFVSETTVDLVFENEPCFSSSVGHSGI